MACSNCSCKDPEPTTGEVNRPVTDLNDLRSDINIIQKQIKAIITFLQDRHAAVRSAACDHTLFSWYEDDLMAKIKYLNNHGYTVLKK